MSSVKKNYIYNLMYQLLLIILPLVTTPYISRVLGAEKVGIYSFTYSIVSYFILFGTLGVALYGQREIAFRQDNKAERTRAFWQINIVKWAAMIISLIAYGFICIPNGDYGIYYMIFLIEMIGSMLDISWYFQGLERFKSVALRNAIVKVLSVVAIFLFVKSPDDLWVYILIFCSANLISHLSLWVSLPKTLSSKPENLFSGVKQHVFPIALMFLPQATMQIYTMFDRTMLGALTGDMDAVGIYEQSQKIIKTALTIVTALGAVMCSRVASLYKQKKMAEIKDSIKRSFHFVWFLAMPIMFGVMATASNMVPWFLGEGFEGAVPVMWIGALLVIAIGLSNVSGTQYLVAMGRQKQFTISIVLGAVVNFIGNLIMIPFWGVNGAIIASVIGEIAVTGSQFIFIRKDFKLKDIFGKAPKCILSAVIMMGVVWSVSLVLAPSILNTVLLAGLGAVVYLAGVITFNDDFVWSSLGKIQQKLSRK